MKHGGGISSLDLHFLDEWEPQTASQKIILENQTSVPSEHNLKILKVQEHQENILQRNTNGSKNKNINTELWVVWNIISVSGCCPFTRIPGSLAFVVHPECFLLYAALPSYILSTYQDISLVLGITNHI